MEAFVYWGILAGLVLLVAVLGEKFAWNMERRWRCRKYGHGFKPDYSFSKGEVIRTSKCVYCGKRKPTKARS